MKKHYLLLTLLSIILFSTSCSSRRHHFHARNPSRTWTNSNYESKKVIYDSYITFSTTTPESINDSIITLVEKKKGYINEEGTSRTIIRVKSEMLEETIEEIEKLGKVTSKKFTGKDVTDEFHDYKIRLENAEKARDRYLELLNQAENVEAALKVEKELERLNEKIDLLKGKINRINHLSEYSTITINYKEYKKPGILGYIGLGIYKGVKWLFIRN